MSNSQINPKKVNKFAKYGGLAFQLLAFILVGYFIGNFFDGKMQNKQPYGAAFGSIVFLIAALYSVIRDIIREK